MLHQLGTLFRAVITCTEIGTCSMILNVYEVIGGAARRTQVNNEHSIPTSNEAADGVDWSTTTLFPPKCDEYSFQLCPSRGDPGKTVHICNVYGATSANWHYHAARMPGQEPARTWRESVANPRARYATRKQPCTESLCGSAALNV
jgi:hypothetical protein